MLAIPRLKLRLRGAVEKLQEEKAFVDNWPPERNYLFFLAKYTLINYAATVNIHYSQSAKLGTLLATRCCSSSPVLTYLLLTMCSCIYLSIVKTFTYIMPCKVYTFFTA